MVDNHPISVSARDTTVDEDSWWEINVVDACFNPEGLKETVAASWIQGATRLVQRCMRVQHDWTFPYACRVLKAYRQFFFLKKTFQDWGATQLSPSLAVDQMWHQHILDVTNYVHDCMLLCGHVLDHNPDGSVGDQQPRIQRLQFVHAALREHFANDYDASIWQEATAEPPHAPLARQRNKEVQIKETTIFRLRDHTGQDTYFRTTKDTKLERVRSAFAERKGVNKLLVQLIFNGELLEGQETPRILELGQDHVVEVVLNQTGC